MKMVAIPDDLAKRVEAAGKDLSQFVVAAIEKELAKPRNVAGKTLAELEKEGLTFPTFQGAPRDDGRPWSEIEASCDPA